jgi:hypothetical protein
MDAGTPTIKIQPLNIAVFAMMKVLRHYLNPVLIDYASLTLSNQMVEQQVMNIRLMYRI